MATFSGSILPMARPKKYTMVYGDGKVWFHRYYVYKTGLRCYDGTSVKAYHYSEDIPFNDIRGVANDRNGAVWTCAMYFY